MTIFNDDDFVDARTFSEHIYDCSFDEIISKGYNPEDEKRRVDIFNPPIVFLKLGFSIPSIYKISKTQNIVFGTKLGVSILQHDERIKTIRSIMDKIDNTDDYLFQQLVTVHKYSYATPIHEVRQTLSTLDWTMDFIKDIHEYLGMTQDQLFISCYLLGVKDAEKLNPILKPRILEENKKFWETITNRTLFLKKNI